MVWMRDYPGGKLAEVALDYARPLGLRRLMRRLGREPTASAQEALGLSSRSRRAFSKELLAFDAICRQAGAAAGDLGDLPLAVITSSERDPRRPEGSKAQRKRSRFYQVWAPMQNELAAPSADSVHVVSASSGHYLNRDDPDLVVMTIADLVRRVRQS